MIKFFRKIRHQLLTENKFTKYLLYAIGEIVLVVIGILIALSINNWNEKRLAQIKVRSYLSDFITDLKADTKSFKGGIEFYNEIIEYKEPLLRITDLSKTEIEKLKDLINLQRFTIKIVDNTYQRVKNSGLTEFVGFDTITKQINDYYYKRQNFHNVMMDWEINEVGKSSDYWEGEQNVYESVIYDLPMFQTKEENRNNLIGLISSPRGRNHLMGDFYRKKRICEHYKNMHELASELIIEIEKELGSVRK